MPRFFRTNFGRKTVRPFKGPDLDNMVLICKKRRNAAEEDSNKEQCYLWDRNYMMLHLGRNLAFRIEDLVQIKDGTNYKNGRIYVREFKTGKEQDFELHPQLVKDLDAYINRNNLIEGEYIFKSRKGDNKPITRQRAWQIIKDLAKEVKITYSVGTHSLRKYFARTYYEQTGDLLGLSEMLNHSSVYVTLIYICWEDDDKTEKRKSFYLGG